MKKTILVICLCLVVISIGHSVVSMSKEIDSESHYHVIHAADHAHKLTEIMSEDIFGK